MKTTSSLICPSCGQQETLTMPTDACQHFYVCPCCGFWMQPKPGDCCVFCSYGDMPCPPKQQEQSCSEGRCA